MLTGDSSETLRIFVSSVFDSDVNIADASRQNSTYSVSDGPRVNELAIIFSFSRT